MKKRAVGGLTGRPRPSAGPPVASRLSARLTAAILLTIVLVIAVPASAQSNYRLAPIGGRTQLLGGTGMVYGRDAAASFLNPATAVLVDDQRLSFAVNFYSLRFLYAPRWYTPGPIDRAHFGALEVKNPTMIDTAFDALPSSLCFFFRARDINAFVRTPKAIASGRARIGFCFATIESEQFDFAAQGFSETHSPSVTRQAQSLTQNFRRFGGGPTYAMHVTDDLAIGASIHGSVANHRSILASSATTYVASPSAITSMFYTASRGTAFQLEALVGATLRMGKQTVGASLKSPSVHVYGTGGVNRETYFDSPVTQTSFVSATGSFVSRTPLRLGLGTGIEEDWGSAELDTTFHIPVGPAFSAQIEGRQVASASGALVSDREVAFDLEQRARGAVNVAVGVELNVTKKVSFLTGLATDFSGTPSGSLNGSLFNYYPSQTHRIAGSFGVSSHGGPSELVIGAELSAGWGQRLAVNSYQLPPQLGTTGSGMYELVFVIAGATNLRTLKRAVEDVRDVIQEPKSPFYNPREHEK